jgi:hypothetical protein
MALHQLPTQDFTAVCGRIRDEHTAGWLTRAGRDVLLAIARLDMAGEPTPTVARIAIEANCSGRTVRRTRAVAEERGLLGVGIRFDIIDGRPQRRANRYDLAVPAAPVVPKPRKSRGGQSGRPIQKKKEKEEKKLLRKWLDEGNRVGPAALAARRAAFMAQQAAQMASRRLL